MIQKLISKYSMAVIFFFLLGSSVTAYSATLKVGEQAPNFNLKNLAGQMISLSSLLSKGHVMLVFWEPECVYCFSHIKDFNALQAKYTDKGFTIAAINFLGEYEDDVRSYAMDNNIQYMMLAERLNNIDVAEAYKVIGSPTIVVISPQGKILFYGYKLPDISQWLD